MTVTGMHQLETVFINAREGKRCLAKKSKRETIVWNDDKTTATNNILSLTFLLCADLSYLSHSDLLTLDTRHPTNIKMTMTKSNCNQARLILEDFRFAHFSRKHISFT